MSRSSLFISLMPSAASLPFFLFTLPGGALVDALSAGRIIRLANLWLAGCAGALALPGSAGLLNPILLLSGVFLLGLGFAINAPAWASLVPQVVIDEELPSASTLSGMQLNISGIFGPAVAGVLLGKVGAPFVFGLNAAGFLLVLTAIPVLPKTGLGSSQILTSLASSISNTLRNVGQTQNVRKILLQNAMFSAFVVVVPALVPVLLLKELRLDASTLGLVFASMGNWLSSKCDLCHTMAAIAILNRCVDDDRPTHSGGYLSSHGDGPPLPVLPDSDGVSRRELDSSSL